METLKTVETNTDDQKNVREQERVYIMSKSHQILRHMEDTKLLRQWDITTKNVNKLQCVPSQMDQLEQLWTQLITEYLQTYRETHGLTDKPESKIQQGQQSEYEVIQTACQMLKARSLAVHKMFLFDVPNHPILKTPKQKSETEKNKKEVETNAKGEEKVGAIEKEEEEIDELTKALADVQKQLEKEENTMTDLLEGLNKTRWNDEQKQKLEQKWKELALLCSSSNENEDSDLAFLREVENDMANVVCGRNNSVESISLESITNSNNELEDKFSKLQKDAYALKAMCETRAKSGPKPYLKSLQPKTVSYPSAENKQNDNNGTRLWDNILL